MLHTTDRYGRTVGELYFNGMNMQQAMVASLHANKMGRTDSEVIFDAKAGLLFHNANGSKKGFSSGSAIAVFEIDQDLSVVSVDFH